MQHKHSSPQRLARELTEDQIAWAWADELPVDYAPLAQRPSWVKAMPRGGPCILRGSRANMYATQQRRRRLCSRFIKHLAFRMRLTSPAKPRAEWTDEDRAPFEFIIREAYKRWPNVQKIHEEVFITWSDMRWINGKAVFDEEMERLRMQTADMGSRELWTRDHLLQSIAASMKQIRAMEG